MRTRPVWLARLGLAAAAVLAVQPLMVGLPAALPADAQTPPQVAGCDVFPADDIWNVPVDTLPVDPASDAYVAAIGADEGFHPDFGSGLYEGGPIGIPYATVPGDQAPVAVSFMYADESDPGPYPIPADAPIEGGPDGTGDRHVLVVDGAACTLYELFNAVPQQDGTWQADAGAVFDLGSHALRPDGWTSADAAGLPVLPGLVRYDEVAAGEIRHALRFTAPDTRRAYVWPARHRASDLEDSQYPPMGQRFRLRADFDLAGYSPEVQVILRALQTYGMILADNGSSWYLSGAPDDRWDNDMLRELRQVLGSDLEAVDVSSLMADPDSGQVQGAGSPVASAPVASAPVASAPVASAPAASVVPASSSAPAPLGSATAPVGSPTALDPVDADLFVDDSQASDSEDGSIARPFSTIAAALTAAADGSTIAVATGDYPENILIQDRTIHLYGGFSADFNSRDPSANVSHLLGDGTDSVVSLIDAADSTLDGFQITGGTNSTAPEFGYLGGGVYVAGGAPTISGNLIEDNDARPPAPGDSDPLGGGIFAGDSNVSIIDNVIRGNTAGRGGGVAITGGSPRVIGNTVQDNIGVADHGGGLYIAATDADISHNLIIGNEIGRQLGYGWGGGIVVFGQGSSAVLSFNDITGNYAPSVGGGVFIDDGATAILDHELIHDNVCPTGGTTGGVGIYVDGYDTTGSTVTVTNSTVAGHDCVTQGGNGLYVEAYSIVTLANDIFWDNAGDDFVVDGTSRIDATYTLAQEALPGEGNLSSDPLFADAAAGDFHLRSTAGRWDPAAGAGAGDWVVDTELSPAIDAGDPTSPYANELDPNGDRADMGVTGNTAEASKSAP